MITKRFSVHSAVVAPVSVDATVAGASVRAEVPGAVIELVAEDGSGSHTLRLVPGDASAEEIVGAFALGETIVATYAPAE